MIRTKLFILTAIFTIGLVSCNSMEDNYDQYLKENKVYSPRVTDLKVAPGLKEATLTWKNPSGQIAIKNAICFNDSTIIIEPMATSYKLTNLQIKGYSVTVYTIDRYNNYSIPTTTYFFPNGE